MHEEYFMGQNERTPSPISQSQQSHPSELTSLANNVMAAVAMAEVIKTTLGPKGLDKLLIDQLGNRVITNDGYTVLVSLRTNHPIGKLLVQIAELQEFTVGDGTTSAVIMAAEMLKEGYRIISEYNIHPSKVIRELDEGISLCSDYLKTSSVNIDSLDEPLVRQIVKTATAAKLDGERISELIMQAINLLNKSGRTDLGHGIILLRRLGEDLFIDGLAIEHLPLEGAFTKNANGFKAALIKNALKLPLKGYPIEGDNDRHDKERMTFVSKIVDNEVNVIITNAPEIDFSLKLDLTSNNIAILRVSTEELDLLSRALRTPSQYAANILEGAPMSFSALNDVEVDEDRGLTIFKSPQTETVATLILGGATKETSKERMRTCTDGISAVHSALKGGIVAGGGIAELNTARFLQKTMTEKKIEKPGWNVLIKGLESISRQILDNCGFNGYETTLKLKSEQDGVGIDVESGNFINMTEKGIVDPLITKLNAIQVAVHVTKTILKIDKNLLKNDTQGETSTS
jgi:chaperonin GroEL (HSP60 family)